MLLIADRDPIRFDFWHVNLSDALVPGGRKPYRTNFARSRRQKELPKQLASSFIAEHKRHVARAPCLPLAPTLTYPDHGALKIVRRQVLVIDENWTLGVGTPPWVQVACTWVKFDAHMTATKICAGRTSPVNRSIITDTVSPA